MTTHLTDEILNEFIDDVIDADARRLVESHLKTCPACRIVLEKLRHVATALKALPEEPLIHDLTPVVLSLLPKQRNRFIQKLILSIQAGIALGLISSIMRAALIFFQPKVDIRLLLTAWINLISRVSFRLPTLDLHQLGLSAYCLPLPASVMAILIAVVAILLGLGNARLLRNGSEIRK
jgi:predicted anti-sigma-YlaC factor YlaD